MKITKETMKQAQKDILRYKEYLFSLKHNFSIIRKTFKEIFGYEIILFENGGFQFKGERFSM